MKKKKQQSRQRETSVETFSTEFWWHCLLRRNGETQRRAVTSTPERRNVNTNIMTLVFNLSNKITYTTNENKPINRIKTLPRIVFTCFLTQLSEADILYSTFIVNPSNSLIRPYYMSMNSRNNKVAVFISNLSSEL